MSIYNVELYIEEAIQSIIEQSIGFSENVQLILVNDGSTDASVEICEKYAQEFNVDPLLIFSMIKAESNFKEKAKSSSGAKGLMQLMEATANEIADKIDEPLVEEESLLEPEKNIMIGTKYYSELLKNFDGNMLLAITAYNAGMGNVNQWIRDGIIKADGSDIENIPYKETNMYVRKIINNYRMYQTIYVEK